MDMTKPARADHPGQKPYTSEVREGGEAESDGGIETEASIGGGGEMLSSEMDLWATDDDDPAHLTYFKQLQRGLIKPQGDELPVSFLPYPTPKKSKPRKFKPHCNHSFCLHS